MLASDGLKAEKPPEGGTTSNPPVDYQNSLAVRAHKHEKSCPMAICRLSPRTRGIGVVITGVNVMTRLSPRMRGIGYVHINLVASIL